jgi:predicted Holliday junction resolvase-like endonuclease
VSVLTKVFVVLTSVVAIVLSCLTVATAARWSNLRENLESYQQLYQAEFVKRTNTEAVMATSLAMKDDELRKARGLVAKRDDDVRQLGEDRKSVV